MAFSGLYIGASGLTAAQRAVEVAAHNVANANTAGFTRQRLTITTSTPTPGTSGARGSGQYGTGVTTVSIDRLRDRLADVAYRSEAGVTGSATARSETLTRAESILGSFGDGANQALSRFQTSWDQLSLSPADPASRASVLTSGQALASSLQSSSQQLTSVTNEIGLRIGDQTSELNGLLSSVATLNGAIARAQRDAQQPNDLLDQRDNALDRIATLTGATLGQDSNGMVTVTVGGRQVVTGSTAESLTAGSDAQGIPTLAFADGTNASPGGSLGGYLSTVHVDLPAFRADLDQLARGLIATVNSIHRAGTGTDGSTGVDFFSGTSAATIAVAITDPAKVAAARSGSADDGSNALAMSGLRTARSVGDNTVAQAMQAFGGRVGQASADASRNARTAEAALSGAQQVRSSADGVNIDEEMVDLVKYQHSYSAAAKVISIVDEMLDKLINQMVR